MIVIGDRVKFDPLYGCELSGMRSMPKTEVEGTVTFVHYKHKWFSVEFGKDQRISFNFADIGREVKVCG